MLYFAGTIAVVSVANLAILRDLSWEGCAPQGDFVDK